MTKALVEVVREEVDLAEDGKFNVLFRKKLIDSNPYLVQYNSVKELINYISNKNAELEQVKIIIRKANRELKIRFVQLYVRKASSHDKDAENRICLTRR